MILSIDQSLSCSGITLWDMDGALKGWFVIKTKPKGEVIIRLREIVGELAKLVKEHKVTTIVIESLPYGANSNSVRPLAALYYFIQDLCIGNSLTFAESNVTAVKKLATGSGKAKKEDMIAALLSVNPAHHSGILEAGIKKTTGLADLADSYFIGRHYIEKVINVSKDG